MVLNPVHLESLIAIHVTEFNIKGTFPETITILLYVKKKPHIQFRASRKNGVPFPGVPSERREAVCAAFSVFKSSSHQYSRLMAMTYS
jgi:hypothetical protein